MSKPFVVGLTGGIGSGKTAVSNLFADKGITVVDADVVARQVVEPGTSALRDIQAHFGDEVINADGTLNRAALRQKVFSDNGNKQWLNALLHPAIRTEMQSQIAQATSAYVILSVPLLVENGLDSMAQRVLVVDCDETTQLSRTLSRDGSDENTIRNIMASQASREARLAKADDVIDNNNAREKLPPQVDSLHEKYLLLAAK